MKRLPLGILLLCGLILGLVLHLFLRIEPATARLVSVPPPIKTEVGIKINLPKIVVPKDKLPPATRSIQPIDRLGLQPFNQVTQNTEKLHGLFTLYRHQVTGRIYLEIQPEQLNKNYLNTVTLESGIGERGIYSGMPLQDQLFYFRRVNNDLHFVVRNENFRTRPGDPQSRSLLRSFSDSVLYSLPIKSIDQRQAILVDLGDLLLTDVPGLSAKLSSVLQGSYRLDEKKSYFGTAKAFPLNLEIESIYGFSLAKGDRPPVLKTLLDSRDLTIRVHYGFSELPKNNGYSPRLADDRVGYFVTAFENFSDDNQRDPFVRYINRWYLEKQDTATLSPPKQPIVFWIENTVPLEYRDAIREGVLMWNKAFEKLGFKNAIQVQQMPDDAKWDPSDIRYNTIRWLNTVDGFFALGPSRVNPLTGEILGADIIVDGSFIRVLKQEYRTIVQQNQSQPRSLLSYTLSGVGSDSVCNQTEADDSADASSLLFKLATHYDFCYGREIGNQFAIGHAALSLSPQMSSGGQKEYISQYLRLIIAHEVGHTLGLRHNFHGSTLLKPEELNNTEITRTRGMVASVMDYITPNLAPPGVKQGDYFPTIIGPYDEWAIEYGYKSSGAATPRAELAFLENIAQASAKPELDYATDEDIFDLDPNVNPWDSSSNVLEYSQWQLENDRAMWKRLERYPLKGDYSELSQVFDTVFLHYLQNTFFITKYIAGQSFHRDHIGEPSGRMPFEPVPVAKQRQALVALQKYVFASDTFRFPPELLNKLAPSRWMDWGNRVPVSRLDYPIHDSIFLMQSLVLHELLSGNRLNRLADIELKSQPGQALTLPELFDTLQTGIWTEVLQPNDKLRQISSLRRALQREHLKIMVAMVLRTEKVPEDASTLAWYKLGQLHRQLGKVVRSNKLDEYTLAHLEETRDRINKALSAQLQSR